MLSRYVARYCLGDMQMVPVTPIIIIIIIIATNPLHVRSYVLRHVPTLLAHLGHHLLITHQVESGLIVPALLTFP